MANIEFKALKGLEVQRWSSAAVRREMGRSGEFCREETFQTEPNGEGTAELFLLTASLLRKAASCLD